MLQYFVTEINGCMVHISYIMDRPNWFVQMLFSQVLLSEKCITFQNYELNSYTDNNVTASVHASLCVH